MVVEQGEVTLSGLVSERAVKRVAEDVAATVSGVKDVHNQLKIGLGAAHELQVTRASGGGGFLERAGDGRNRKNPYDPTSGGN